MEDNENDVVASIMASVKCCAKNGTHCWAIDWLTSFNHNLSKYTAYQQSMHLTDTGYVMICDMPQTRINKICRGPSIVVLKIPENLRVCWSFLMDMTSSLHLSCPGGLQMVPEKAARNT